MPEAKKKDFTDAEREILQSAALAVWNEIGYDCLVAIAESKGRKVEAVTISRRDVIELVCDASRLEQYLRDHGHRELAEKLSPLWGLAKLVKPAFTYTRYGM